MKRIRSYLFTTTFLLALMFFSSVPVIGTPTYAEAATIKLSQSEISIPVNTTKLLSISGTSKKVTWTSSNTSIATINTIGYVTAKSEGTAIITASVNGKVLKCKVTVYIPMSISSTSLTLNAGKSDTLEVIGATKSPIWTSSNNAIARVTKRGTVTGIAKGSTVITATIGKRKLTSKVTVIEPIAISNKSINLEEGQSQSLKIVGINYRATWTTSNTSIAIVSMYGKITALKAGKVTITAYVDGEKLSCSVTVTKASNISEKTVVLKTGEKSSPLTPPVITVSPVDPGNTDTSTVTGSAITSDISNVSDGSITSETSAVSGSVITTEPSVVSGSVITTEPSVVSGSSIFSDPSVVSGGAISTTPELQWQSSNPSIATVSDDGVVQGLKSGTAIITAIYEDQKFTYLAIVVSKYNPFVSKAPFSVTLESSDKLNYVLPANWNATNQKYPTKGTSIAFPNYNDGSNIIITYEKQDKYSPDFNATKKYLKSLSSLEQIKFQYKSALMYTGIHYSIKNYKQSEFQSDIGKVIKTELKVNMEGESFAQTVYDFYYGNYLIEIVITDDLHRGYNNVDVPKMGEYILNSITISN